MASTFVNKLMAGIGVLVITGALAACGSSGDGSLTEAEYMQQAEQICREEVKTKTAAIRELYAEIKKTKKQPTLAEQEDLVSEIPLPPLEEAVKELSELEPPDELQGKSAQMVKSFEKAIKTSQENPRLVITNYLKVFGEPFGRATKLGLKTCAKI
jgi:hypothetical protein